MGEQQTKIDSLPIMGYILELNRQRPRHQRVASFFHLIAGKEEKDMAERKDGMRGLTRRDFLYLSGLGMAGMSIAGLPGLARGADKKPKYGGRIRIGERYGSTGLDAHKNQFFMDFQNYLLMYNALTIMGPLPQVRIYPDVAKSWEISKDGREYTFPLREGVKFHHGKEMDSADVKYSIERVMTPATRSPRAFAYRWIDSVNIVDKYHLKIKLKEPFGPFLSTLTIMNCPIIPNGWEPSGTKPAPGTGPFVFKSFVPNETTEFTRFDNYWEVDEETGMRLPYLDGVYIKKIVDEMVRWTGLRAGDLDYINNPPRSVVVEELKKPTPGIVSVMPQPVAYVAIIFNTTKPPFDKKKVREAIAYAIDKKELIKAAYWGLGEPVNNQPFSSGLPEWIQDRIPHLLGYDLRRRMQCRRGSTEENRDRGDHQSDRPGPLLCGHEKRGVFHRIQGG